MSDDAFFTEPDPMNDHTPDPEWQREATERLIETAQNLTAQYVFYEAHGDEVLLRSLNDIRDELNYYTCASIIRNAVRKFDSQQLGLHSFLTEVLETLEHNNVELPEVVATDEQS